MPSFPTTNVQRDARELLARTEALVRRPTPPGSIAQLAEDLRRMEAEWQVRDRHALPPRPSPLWTPVTAVPERDRPHARRYDWFVAQEKSWSNLNEDHASNSNCGPAAVTMVARAFGKVRVTPATADDVIERTRRLFGASEDEDVGTFQAGVVRAARAYGLQASALAGAGPAMIQGDLEQGRLVIVSLTPTYVNPAATNGHYVVVTAIAGGYVYLNDPGHPDGPSAITVAAYEQAVRKRGTNEATVIWP